MTRFLITIITLIASANVSISQSIKIFEGRKFHGAIFPNSYKNSAYNWLDDNKRFTPTKEEVQKFENNLYHKLKRINKNYWNQDKNCPVIHNNLKKYVRQYSGFIDDSGKKYLLINLLWTKSILQQNPNEEFYSELEDWKRHWQIWFDGCSHFWNVKYNLETEVLFDLQINSST